MTMSKTEALAGFLEIDTDEITECSDSRTFEIGRKEYLVLTDEEADEMARERIEDSLWAFNPSFLVRYIDNAPRGLEKVLRAVAEESCEDASPMIRLLVGDNFDRLVRDATMTDGRGHFLASYDGNEEEAGPFYVYRMN